MVCPLLWTPRYKYKDAPAKNSRCCRDELVALVSDVKYVQIPLEYENLRWLLATCNFEVLYINFTRASLISQATIHKKYLRFFPSPVSCLFHVCFHHKICNNQIFPFMSFCRYHSTWVWKQEVVLSMAKTRGSPSSRWDSKTGWRCQWVISVTVAAVRRHSPTAASVAPQVLHLALLHSVCPFFLP